MYYAELLILIYRYKDEAYLPICTNEALKRAIAYIRLNYHSEININNVAEHTGVSERYLRSLFSQYLNLSPLDYLNQIRINKAVELLRNTEMSIKKYVFNVGSSRRNISPASSNNKWESLPRNDQMIKKQSYI